MGSLKFHLALVLVCITTFALINSSFAQDLPQDYVDAHNTARSAVGVGPITWNQTLATYAQNYANGVQSANTCNNLVHSGGPYGENLAAGYPDLTGVGAVNLWVAEKSNYDYATNTCAAGKVCGHYTQVVWRNSVRLGCARVHCADGWSYVICSYDPPGNYIGQKPY